MEKCNKYSAGVLCLSRQLLLSCIMVLCLGLSAQAQDAGSGSDQSKVGEELNQFVNRFLDWVVLSYATYTGQHDAELESIFAKAKDALDKQPEVQEFLQEIQSASSENGLEQVVRDFTNKTGIGVYFVPQIVNNKDGFYVPIFNDFLAEGAKNPVAPYVIVKPVIDGDNKGGYNISYTIETSPDLNPKKYNLDQANANNPFNAIAGQATKRQDLITMLKPNLAGGVVTLTNTVDENFLPKLVITYEGNVYRPGEEIEVGMETDSTAEIRLVAKNRDGSAPKRTVKWSISPETVERKVRGSDLLFPQTQAGQWAIMAESGSNKATVGVKVVNFNLDWKAIVKTMLYEALQSQLQKTQAKIDSLEAAGAGNDSELRTQLSKIEEANYPLEPDGSLLHNLYEQPLTLSGQDTIRFYSNSVRADGFKKLRKFKKHLINVLQKVNMAAFIDILIEDPKKFEELLDNMVNDSGSLVVEIVTATLDQSERDGKIQKVVIDYLNANLVRLADAEFAGKHEAPEITPEAQPETADQGIPTLEYENYYINPLIYFKGIEEFKVNLRAKLDAMTNPPFVVINYSQDISAQGYINRGPTGRPKGLAENRKYLVYTLVNIPGSVNETVVQSGGDGSKKISSADGIIDQLDEGGIDPLILEYIRAKAQELNLTYEDVLALVHCKACTENGDLDKVNSGSVTYTEFGGVNSPSMILNAPNLKCISIFYNKTVSTTQTDEGVSTVTTENFHVDPGTGRDEYVNDSEGLKIIFVNTNQIVCNNDLSDLDALLDCSVDDDISEAYIDKLYDKVTECLDGPLDEIVTTLRKLRDQSRSNQHIEFEADGIVYTIGNQNQLQEVKDPLTNNQIKNGEWTDPSIDQMFRVHRNQNGVLQFKMAGIRDNLPIFDPTKEVHLDELSQNMVDKGNAFLLKYSVTNVDQTPQDKGAKLESDQFPDGERMSIDESSSFFKIIYEGAGLMGTLLTTGEIEEPTYLNSTKGKVTIHGPPIVTGSTEAAVRAVTDITGTVVMIYDLAVDEQARTDALNGLASIKDQIVDDPDMLWPLLGESLLEEASGNSLQDWQDASNENADMGKRKHIYSKGTVRTATSIFFGGKFIARLPKIADDLILKLARAKGRIKIKDVANLTETLKDNLEDLLKKVENLPDMGKQFLADFADASNEVLEAFLKKPSLVDGWSRLNDWKRPSLRKDLETLQSLEKIISSEKLKKVFDDDYLKSLSDAQKAAGSGSVPPMKALFGNIEKAFSKLDLSKVKNIDLLKNELKRTDFGKMIGANWTLEYIGKNADLFKAFDEIIFESVEKIDEATGKLIRRVDLKAIKNQVATMFEFKSVQPPLPPGGFADQFVKDLKLSDVKSLDQIKWVFDGNKVSKLTKSDFLDALEDVTIPTDVIKKFVKSGPITKDKLLDLIETDFDKIFIAVK